LVIEGGGGVFFFLSFSSFHISDLKHAVAASAARAGLKKEKSRFLGVGVSDRKRGLGGFNRNMSNGLFFQQL
jgi:hypothetical protein